MTHDPQFQTPIAIVGMGCRLPGADGLDQFWDLLSNGRSAVGELPADFFDRDLYYDAEVGKRGRTYSTVGGLVQPRALDLELCPLTRGDLQNYDPAHLNLCEVAASACRHGGYDPRDMSIRNTGVFIGHSAGSNFGSEIVFGSLIPETLDYLRDVPEFQQLDAALQDAIIADVTQRIQRGRPTRDSKGAPHVGPNVAASLIAKTLKLNGPHLVTDAACASSLVAFSIGAAALQRGDIEMAIVGGASYNKLESLILFSQARSCSATGSRPFDDDADGLVSSEGYVSLLIKTLPRALADGDTIHAVVPGLGISTDGRGRSLWAPRKEGQVESMRRAYGDRLDRSRINFVEAHATSTQIGDATEMEAIAEYLGPGVDQAGIPIGSVKSNIGHTLETAGVAGLLKAVLAIKHNQVPPTINVTNPNKSVPWENLPFRIAHQSQPLPPNPDGTPRRAAVNAFGIGGLNVHVVVDEYNGQTANHYDRPETGSELQARIVSSPETESPEPIAIVGRGSILPGASSIEDFARLVNGQLQQETITAAPEHRWRKQVGVNPGAIRPGATPHNRGGFITDYEFDWLRYRIPPKQIANSNPLQFMLLDTARQALREAGYETTDDDRSSKGSSSIQSEKPELDRSRTGVIVGTIFGGEFGHQLLMGLRLAEITERLTRRLCESGIDAAVANSIVEDFSARLIKNKPAVIDETGSFTSSTLASRVSKELNLMGGAMAIDAGECSSTAALNVAVNMLRSGTCEHVLCAGAQRSMDLGNYETLALQGRLTGSDSKDPNGGFVPAEGVTMLLLKTLSQAQADGNNILGVIHGVGGGYNHSTPQSAIKVAAQRATQTNKRLAAQVRRSVGGVNIAATDQAECKTMSQVFFAAETCDDQQSLIRKVGNLLSARGLTSVLQQTLRPDSTGMTAISDLGIDGQDYQVVFRPGTPAIANVADVNASGVNTADTMLDASDEPTPQLYRFGAASAEQMQSVISEAISVVAARIPMSAKASFGASDRFRLAVVSDSLAALQQKLELAGKQWQNASAAGVLNAKGVFVGWDGDGSHPGNAKYEENGNKIVFVFPGQGSQHSGMLKGVIAASTAARNTMREADKVLAEIGSPSFAEIAWQSGDRLNEDPWLTQAGVLLADIFMYEALLELGVKPDCVCGHSFGEIPALYASGALSLRDTILLTRARAESLNIESPVAGGLLSVHAAAADVEQQLNAFHAARAEQLYLTHTNAPQQSVVGGNTQLLNDFDRQLSAAGIATQRLNVPQAFHTPLMSEASRRFAAAIAEIKIVAPQTRMLSGISNEYVDHPDAIRQMLVSQLVEPVRHVEMVRRLISDGCSKLVEVGPQRVLSGLNRQICADHAVQCIATDHPRKSDTAAGAMSQLLAVRAMLETASLADRPERSPVASQHSAVAKTTATGFLPGASVNSKVEMNQQTASGVQASGATGSGSTGTHASRRIDFFDATLPRKQRQRNSATPMPVRKASQNGNGHGDHALANYDATELRKQRRRDDAVMPAMPAQRAGAIQNLADEPAAHAVTASQPALTGPASPSTQGGTPTDADSLQTFLVDFIVQETGYPAEIIDIDWEFEADLGIDSIKKAQMFGELRELFDLDSMSDQFIDAGKFSLDKFKTLRDVLDLLRQCDTKGEWQDETGAIAVQPGAGPAGVASITPAPAVGIENAQPLQMPQPPATGQVVAETERESTAVISDNGLENFLIDFVIEQTGYPREIIEMDADFEADLGIDSIKKAQLFGELREHFSLDMKHFESIDRATFSEIKTLADIKGFLQNIPQVNEAIAAKVVDAQAVDAQALVTSSASAAADAPVTAAPAKSLESSASPIQSVAASTKTDNRRVAKRSGDLDPEQAYARGLETGRANTEQIKKTLLSLVSQRLTDVPGITPHAARELFTESAYSEMQGIADGAGVHVGNVVSYNHAAMSGGDTAGCPALIADNSEIVDSSAAASLVNVPEKTADTLVKPETRVTSRYVLRTVPQPHRAGSPEAPELSGASIIIGTNAVAQALRDRIRTLGFKAYCIEPTDDYDAAIDRLNQIWVQGAAPHLFIVSPRDEEARSSGDWTQWRERRARDVMLPFWFCREWLGRVQRENLMDDASLMAVISSGGDIGFQQPVHAIEGGGIAGLLKSILIESWVNGHRTTAIKVVDAAPDQPPASIADAALSELANPSYDYEVAWKDGVRNKVLAKVDNLAADRAVQPIPHGSHWVCTGGARGITAFVCSELASRYGLKLSLIGTTPRPDIPSAWHSLSEEENRQLKLKVMTDARANGRNPITAWENTEKEIEIDGSLRAMQQAGISVNYYACNVADPIALNEVLDAARSAHGPIDAVLHGAGVGKDSRYENKKPEMVDRCIGAKVDGALALMAATRSDPLKYFVGFGSISGRFGANGHADYSLANEMLAKTVGWYRAQRPDVKSVAFHWHAWGDVGMATRAETKLALEMINMQFMPALEGLQHLIDELECERPEREILITDDRYYRLFFPAETLSSETNIDATNAPQYPMLERGETNEVDGKLIASVELDPNEDPFLKEHRLDDKPLLPIVIGLEILAEAGAKQLRTMGSPEWNSLEFRDIEALNGLKFHNDNPITAKVIADGGRLSGAGVPNQQTSPNQPAAQCQLVADFYSRSGQLVESDRPYLHGTVVPADPHHQFRPPTPIPADEWHRVEYPAYGSKFYAGPPLQRLRKIKVSGKKSWGRIAAPANVELAGAKQSITGWLVPSSALDACLFATGLLAWFTIDPGSALPSAMGRLTLGRMPSPGENCIVESTFKRREDRYAWFDFSLYGNDGSTIVEVEDYRIVWLSE